jgi:predicted alpha/beta-fold hydrolase
MSACRTTLLLALVQLLSHSLVTAFRDGILPFRRLESAQSAPSLEAARRSRHRAQRSLFSIRRTGAGPLMAALAELDRVGEVAIRHEYVKVSSDVTLHVVVAGEGTPGTDAPTICLLHGFPDFWLSWHRQLQGLVEGGYRVVCPDLRGYGKSSKPSGIERYSEVEITGDVDALRKHFCGEEGQFELLAGHDWGAACAWGTMSWYQSKLE